MGCAWVHLGPTFQKAEISLAWWAEELQRRTEQASTFSHLFSAQKGCTLGKCKSATEGIEGYPETSWNPDTSAGVEDSDRGQKASSLCPRNPGNYKVSVGSIHKVRPLSYVWSICGLQKLLLLPHVQERETAPLQTFLGLPSQWTRVLSSAKEFY